MRVGFDATPLLGARTGIGQYTAGLITALARLSDGPYLRLVPFTWRGAAELPAVAPTGPRLEVRTRRVPARLLRESWSRTSFPTVELLAGNLEIFHGTNFVLPPMRRARGVVTVHDLAYLHHPRWVNEESLRYRELVPRALQRASVVCTVSATVRRELLEAYPQVPAERVLVTPNGVPAAAFRATAPPLEQRRRQGIPDRYVLFVGTLEPRKGLDTLLDAYRLLHARRQPAPPLLVVGGAGWGARPELHGLGPDVVRFTGYLPDEQVLRLMAGAELLAFPSRYEGFGIPPLEAFATGTPVLASDLPVLREVLGAAASYAPIGDAEAWADALTATLAAGRGTTEQVTARRHRARLHSWDACATASMTAYRRALA